MKHLTGLNLILGVWLLVWPFAFGYYTVSPIATWNDVILGFMIITCAWCVVTEVPGSALCSVCGMVCGAWLMLSPVLLNYRVEPFGSDVIIGAFVLVISVIETWRITNAPQRLA